MAAVRVDPDHKWGYPPTSSSLLIATQSDSRARVCPPLRTPIITLTKESQVVGGLVQIIDFILEHISLFISLPLLMFYFLVDKSIPSSFPDPIFEQWDNFAFNATTQRSLFCYKHYFQASRYKGDSLCIQFIIAIASNAHLRNFGTNGWAR